MDNPQDNVNVMPLLPQDKVNEMFEELGLSALSDDRKENMMEQMVDTILNRVMLRVEPSLTEADKDLLDELQEKDDGQAMTEFLMSRASNLPAIADEEIQNYKAELKRNLQVISDTIDEEIAKQEHN